MSNVSANISLQAPTPNIIVQQKTTTVPKIHVCTFCEKKYKTRSGLKYHHSKNCSKNKPVVPVTLPNSSGDLQSPPELVTRRLLDTEVLLPNPPVRRSSTFTDSVAYNPLPEDVIVNSIITPEMVERASCYADQTRPATKSPTELVVVGIQPTDQPSDQLSPTNTLDKKIYYCSWCDVSASLSNPIIYYLNKKNEKINVCQECFDSSATSRSVFEPALPILENECRNTFGDLLSPSEIVVRRLSTLLPNCCARCSINLTSSTDSTNFVDDLLPQEVYRRNSVPNFVEERRSSKPALRVPSSFADTEKFDKRASVPSSLLTTTTIAEEDANLKMNGDVRSPEEFNNNVAVGLQDKILLYYFKTSANIFFVGYTIMLVIIFYHYVFV
jgi:hypothetical protein